MAKYSIKSFLVVNLLLSVTLVSSVAIVGNLFLEHQGFQKNLDSQLSITAHTIASFSNNISSFAKIQEEINAEIKTHDKNFATNSIQFMLVANSKQILVKSKFIPDFDFQNITPGYHDLWLNSQPWRLLYIQNKGLGIYTLQKHDFRAKLEKEITEESFIIMLITYPFLGILIWAVVSKGFSGIDIAIKSLGRRKRSNLKPLIIEDAPAEIEPLIQSINSLLGRLDDSFKREQRFAGDAAHELKTPLAALSAHLQLVNDEKDPQKISLALNKLAQCVDRSTHVVEQLLTLSRMSSGAEINDPEELNLNEIAKTIIIELLPFADEKAIEIELIGEAKHKVIGNHLAIMIMLRNLIDNSIRYSPEKSIITVKLDNDIDSTSISVIDQGPGIPQNLKERVFERFFRVIGNNAKGSGLGLGIVKEIVNFHNAKIELYDGNPGLIVKVIFGVNNKLT